MTTNLTPAELAELRADFAAEELPDRGEWRRRPTGSPAGAPWDVLEDALPCRLTVSTGRQTDAGLSEVAARVGASGILRCAVGTDLQRHDALMVDGRRCEVLLVLPAPRALATALVGIEGIPAE